MIVKRIFFGDPGRLMLAAPGGIWRGDRWLVLALAAKRGNSLTLTYAEDDS